MGDRRSTFDQDALLRWYTSERFNQTAHKYYINDRRASIIVSPSLPPNAFSLSFPYIQFTCNRKAPITVAL